MGRFDIPAMSIDCFLIIFFLSVDIRGILTATILRNAVHFSQKLLPTVTNLGELGPQVVRAGAFP